MSELVRMTRFIKFRDVVLNADAIQYVMIVPTDHQMRKELNWSEADWAVKVVIGKDSDATYFAYATRSHAKEAIEQIYKILNPPALFVDGGTIIDVPPSTDPSTRCVIPGTGENK